MASLESKGQKWLHLTLKSVIFFAILGSFIFLLAVKAVEKMFNDVIGQVAPPAQTTQDQKKEPKK